MIIPRAAALALLLAGALALLIAGAAVTAHAERIESFESEVYLGTDDDFSVVEKIRYDFGTEQRRGIYRDIPIAYGRGRAADYRIRLKVQGVSDAQGNDRPYKVIGSGQTLRIRIGDPDRTLSGVQDYWIRYRVERAYLYLESHDEFYWNATGDLWDVPMGMASAAVYLPEGVAARGLDHACHVGPRGAVGGSCSVVATPGSLRFRTQGPLAAGEGLTVVVGLPKGVLAEPSPLERFLSRLGDYLNAWALLPLLALGGMSYAWRTRGRDPQGGAAIPVRYEPPEGLTPAEVGTVVDEEVDLIDITSSILDLAIRGFLRLEELEAEGFLFLKERDVRLVKLREPQGLRRHETLLMKHLFVAGDQVLISSLKDVFYEHLEELEQALYDEVSRKGRFFPTSPRKVRRLWAGGGFLLLTAGVGSFFSNVVPAAALPLGLAGLVVLGFAKVMPRRTRRGRRIYEEILGFKEFVGRVDRDRLERMGRLEPGTFEKVLPFAIVLGVADQWAGAFADLYTEPPRWYRSADPHAVFRPRAFVSNLGGSLDTIGQTLSSRPSSSGSGSSGLGGGGFSGGGFGGGGGGSW